MDKILRIKEVLELTGLSKSTLRRMEQQGTFPKRTKLSRRAIGWLESEIRAWINHATLEAP